MAAKTLNIKSIAQLHQLFGWESPKHPLISIVDAQKLVVPESEVGTRAINELFTISLKDKSCGMEYGRNQFDFDEGVMVFTAPKQVSIVTKPIELGEIKGWILYFHPDLLFGTYLGQRIDDYSFFNYEAYEALHLSEEEEKSVNDCIRNIENEYRQRIDNHSQRVIVSNLELLLNYCLRYYERQFNTRKKQNSGVAAQFEKEMIGYFSSGLMAEKGLPSIQFFADKIHLSQHYLSDLLKKETGRSAKDHINDFVVEKAKNLLRGSDDSISEIAYSLGFNYPHYFTRMFKARTGSTPAEFRQLN